MYGYISWPGVYSFKQEIGMFMEYLREQIDEVMKICKAGIFTGFLFV